MRSSLSLILTSEMSISNSTRSKPNLPLDNQAHKISSYQNHDSREVESSHVRWAKYMSFA
ncbi:hypothetical protein O3G_MSEX007679 [Manduca sexta]|nr:hypothetical protein O3G_MSEX007679 [Manduca sexta]